MLAAVEALDYLYPSDMFSHLASSFGFLSPYLNFKTLGETILSYKASEQTEIIE